MNKRLFSLMLPVIFSILWSSSLNAQGKGSVTLASLEWPPFCGAKLQQQGLINHIVKSSFEAAGYHNIRFQYYPWQRAIIAGQQSQVDAISPAWKNPSRQKSFYFSRRIYTNKKVFLRKQGSSTPKRFRGLKALKPYRIGIVRGYTYSPQFDRASYLTKDLSPNSKVLLRKLIAGRIHLALESHITARYISRNLLGHKSKKIHALQPPYRKEGLYVIFPKKNKNSIRLRQDFNRGLRRIKNNGTYPIILRRHNIR